jgi:hypothetical protein
MSNTRRQLVEMRQRLIGNLGERIEGGDLALLAAVNGALGAIDAADCGPVNAEPMARAIVTDIPGEPIVLTLNGDDGRAVSVELTALRALNLATRLIDASLRRLGG